VHSIFRSKNPSKTVRRLSSHDRPNYALLLTAFKIFLENLADSLPI